jgi:hypothetical protein
MDEHRPLINIEKTMETVYNRAVHQKTKNVETFPSAIEDLKSSVTLTKAVVVLCPCLKPD